MNAPPSGTYWALVHVYDQNNISSFSQSNTARQDRISAAHWSLALVLVSSLSHGSSCYSNISMLKKNPDITAGIIKNLKNLYWLKKEQKKKKWPSTVTFHTKSHHFIFFLSYDNALTCNVSQCRKLVTKLSPAAICYGCNLNFVIGVRSYRKKQNYINPFP